MSLMSESVSQIYVVDDDVSVREASCWVLDIQLPDISGFELQQELATKDIQIPIIFLTGHGDIPMSVRAIKAGALEFLTKPFDDEYLLEAIRSAIARDNRNERPPGTITKEGFEGDRGTDLASRAMPDQAEIVFSPRLNG